MELMRLFLVLYVAVTCGTPTSDVPAPETSVNKEEKEDLYRGDIILTNEQKMQLYIRKVMAVDSNLWINGNDPTVINYSLDNIAAEAKKNAIKDGIEEWERHTCVSFVEASTPPYLNFIETSGCSSTLGKNPSGSGFQDISIANGCETLGQVLHEIGHSLGFHHEQERSDRDDYVDVLTENVMSDRLHNFDKETTRNFDLPYDYYSVMHFRTNTFTDVGLQTILPKGDPSTAVFMGQRTALSFYDKKMANLAYNCITKWMDSCSVTVDPCQNEGYLGSNCECVCRPGTSGTNCENENNSYYDAVDEEDDGIARSVIRIPGTITSVPGKTTQRQIYHIIAPTCHVIKFTVSSFGLYRKVKSSAGNNICYHEYLSVRTDLSTSSHTVSCATELASGTEFTSTGNEMVLETKLHPYLTSQWTGDVTFQRTCDAVAVTAQDSDGGCTFEQQGTDYYFNSPDYPNGVPSGSFNCTVSFSPDAPATYEISYVQWTPHRFNIYYWNPAIWYKMDKTDTPNTSVSSGGKLKVISWVGNTNNPLNVSFSVKIVPIPANPIIEIAEGESYNLVHNEPSPGPSTEYRLRCPEGKRLRISFTEFSIGNSTENKCRNRQTNYLAIGRYDDVFYSKRWVNCLEDKDLTGKISASVSNVLNLFVNSPLDMEDKFTATVTVF